MGHVWVGVLLATLTLCRSTVEAQSAKDVRGPSPLIAIENEPPPRLIVDPPLAEPLSRGLVFIQYRTENLRVVPVFGKGALEVSPRIGHVHVTVDDVGWHFVDASGETLRSRSQRHRDPHAGYEPFCAGNSRGRSCKSYRIFLPQAAIQSGIK